MTIYYVFWQGRNKRWELFKTNRFNRASSFVESMRARHRPVIWLSEYEVETIKAVPVSWLSDAEQEIVRNYKRGG